MMRNLLSILLSIISFQQYNLIYCSSHNNEQKECFKNDNEILELEYLNKTVFILDNKYSLIKLDSNWIVEKKVSLRTNSKMIPKPIRLLAIKNKLYLFWMNGDVEIFDQKINLIKKIKISPQPASVTLITNKIYTLSWEFDNDYYLTEYDTDLKNPKKILIHKKRSEWPYADQFTFDFDPSSNQIVFLYKFINKIELRDRNFKLLDSLKVVGIKDTADYEVYSIFDEMLNYTKNNFLNYRNTLGISRVPKEYLHAIVNFKYPHLLISNNIVDETKEYINKINISNNILISIQIKGSRILFMQNNIIFTLNRDKKVIYKCKLSI
jgi:hypothetical protein